MVDIHCHLIPSIDDGPSTLDASLNLARALVSDGVSHAVLTPHVFPDRYDNDVASIAHSGLEFEGHLRSAGIPLSVSFGGEVRMCAASLVWLTRGRLPLLSNFLKSKTMLVEMPDGQIPLGAEQFLTRLLEQEITPVIAHPERNRGIMERPGKIKPLVELGCLLQLTAGSLVGQFGSKAQAAACSLVDLGVVDAVASDSHNLAGRRPRMLDARSFLARRYGESAAFLLTDAGPRRLAGLALE